MLSGDVLSHISDPPDLKAALPSRPGLDFAGLQNVIRLCHRQRPKMDQEGRDSSKPRVGSESRVSVGQERRHALLPRQRVAPTGGRLGHEEGEKDG
jgi:hypothetical protein